MSPSFAPFTLPETVVLWPKVTGLGFTVIVTSPALGAAPVAGSPAATTPARAVTPIAIHARFITPSWFRRFRDVNDSRGRWLATCGPKRKELLPGMGSPD